MPAISGVVGMFGVPLVVPEVVMNRLRALGNVVLAGDGRYVGHCVGRENLTKLSERLNWSVGQTLKVDNKDSVLNGLIAEISDVSRLDTHGEIKAFVDMLDARREVKIAVESLCEVGA